MPSATRTYGGMTAEQRRTRRRAALLEATIDLVAEEGLDGVTVRGVCARARLNDRYFYESFADRDELLVAVADDVAADGLHTVLTAIDGLPPDAATQVRAASEAAVGFVLDDPRRGRLLVESQASEALRRRRNDVVRGLATVMVERGRELLGEGAPAEQDAELVALTLIAGSLEVLSIWLRGELAVSRERLIAVLTGMVLSTTEHPAAFQRR